MRSNLVVALDPPARLCNAYQLPQEVFAGTDSRSHFMAPAYISLTTTSNRAAMPVDAGSADAMNHEEVRRCDIDARGCVGGGTGLTSPSHRSVVVSAQRPDRRATAC
jgi:D-alanyl-D-alanine carboxypeptidase